MLFKGHLAFPFLEVIMFILNYLCQGAEVEKLGFPGGFVHVSRITDGIFCHHRICHAQEIGTWLTSTNLVIWRSLIINRDPSVR